MIKSDPVCGIHFLLDVPGYDQGLTPVQRELQSGRCEWRPALGGHQVRVAVGPCQSDRTADNGSGVDGRTAPLRQSPQVFRAEGVPQVRTAPPWSWQVFPASNSQVGWIVGAGPGWEDCRGEGRTHVVRLVFKNETRRRQEEEELQQMDRFLKQKHIFLIYFWFDLKNRCKSWKEFLIGFHLVKDVPGKSWFYFPNTIRTWRSGTAEGQTAVSAEKLWFHEVIYLLNDQSSMIVHSSLTTLTGMWV